MFAAVFFLTCATAVAQIESTGTPGRIAKFNTTNSDGGSSDSLFFQANRSGTQSSGNIRVVISGYLVDLP
jgi:hypothetical protein